MPLHLKPQVEGRREPLLLMGRWQIVLSLRWQSIHTSAIKQSMNLGLRRVRKDLNKTRPVFKFSNQPEQSFVSPDPTACLWAGAHNCTPKWSLGLGLCPKDPSHPLPALTVSGYAN